MKILVMDISEKKILMRFAMSNVMNESLEGTK